jgi:hypothetical protein
MKFSFRELAAGKLGISARSGAALAESAEFCLHRNHHPGPVRLTLSGDITGLGYLEWDAPEPTSALRTYGDLKRATEDGACAVAIVVVTQTEAFPAVMKASQGTGFDYWLTSNDDTNLFLARLEVSGILSGSARSIHTREHAKIQQTKQSDETKLPAYAAIVEFSNPEVRTTKRNCE